MYFYKYAIKNALPPANNGFQQKLERTASQPGGILFNVTDEFMKHLDLVKDTNSGIRNRYIPGGDGSPKLMYEGKGLKPFLGEFEDMNKNIFFNTNSVQKYKEQTTNDKHYFD